MSEEESGLGKSVCFGAAVVGLAVAGSAVNAFALVALSKIWERNVFQRILRILSGYDLAAVILCGLTYGLPNTYDAYSRDVLPWIGFLLSPSTHIVIMTSVYLTVLLSFERYIRICYTCKMRSTSVITRDNLRKYLIAVTIFPVLFYVPKFFEFAPETAEGLRVADHSVSCLGTITKSLENVDFNEGAALVNNLRKAAERRNPSGASLDGFIEPECFELLLNTTEANASNLTSANTTSSGWAGFVPSRLRKSALYYKVYLVGLNFLLATAVPLALLVFFNLRTTADLRNLRKDREERGVRLLQIALVPNIPEPDVAFNRTTDKVSILAKANVANVGGEEERSQNIPILSEFRGDRRDLTTSILRSMCSNTQDSKELRLARVSVCIVWLFIACHMWRVVLTIYELSHSKYGAEGTVVEEWPGWVVFVEHLSHTLVTLNSAVNFLFYACTC